MGRIKALPSGVANQVRASQVIGSIERGVEELLHNAIIHGAARSVTVTMLASPNFIIKVDDDGIGIDNESMRTLIGTEACCGDAYTVFGSQGRGDSLHSICFLSEVVKIESTFKSKNGYVSSSKVINNGVTVSFNDSTNDRSSSSSIIPSMHSIPANTKTGTQITLHHFFSRFAVRRKHHQSKDLLVPVRTMMNMLALVYPLVSLKLMNGETGKVDFIVDAPSYAHLSGPLTCRVHGFVTTLKEEANALVERLDRMSADEDLMSRRSFQLVGEDGRDFRAFGVIFLVDDERKNQVQVAINGRPAAQTKHLVETIQGYIKKFFGGNYCKFIPLQFLLQKINIFTFINVSHTEGTAGFVHIASKDSELIIKDSQAMEIVSDLNRLSTFLESLISRAFGDSSFGGNNKHYMHIPSSNTDRRGRLVKGDYVTAKPAAKKSTLQKSPPISPFSDIFCDEIPQTRALRENDNDASFDDAFLDESTYTYMNDTATAYDDIGDEEPTMSWTRNRIKAFNSSISELAPSCHNINLTKDMLASAEVISQVDSSFIMIKIGSLICAVDQHAADERVSLEALENALFHRELHEATIICLTKRKIQVGDILKSCPVAPARNLTLSTSQMTTARHFHSLLHKWKFEFEESSVEERTIILRGLPSVCGKVATPNNLLEFLHDLSGCAGGSSIKPKFVNRVLQSNACRYSNMFGEAMSQKRCEELIEALSKCRLPFVCAHGRPSIIPIIDMSQGQSHEETKLGNNHEVYSNTSLTFGPTRVLQNK